MIWLSKSIGLHKVGNTVFDILGNGNDILTFVVHCKLISDRILRTNRKCVISIIKRCSLQPSVSFDKMTFCPFLRKLLYDIGEDSLFICIDRVS